MFKKILFATTSIPSSDAPARVAFDFAKRYDATLNVIHVFGIPGRGFSQTVKNIRTGDEIDLHDEFLQQIRDELELMYAEQIKNYKECTFDILEGIPSKEILRAVREKDIDLIVMGARTYQDKIEKASQRHLAGLTLQKVARAARCPVLIISRPAASFWGGISKIVFATDFSKASDSAFRFAYKLVKTFECSFNLFHAMDISSNPFEMTRDQDALEDRIREARAKIREKYVSRMEGFHDYEIDVWEGIPYVEVVKYAREKYADLIAMAHHTREMDPETAVLGTTVEQVVLRSNCPVISVNHPDKIGDI